MADTASTAHVERLGNPPTNVASNALFRLVGSIGSRAIMLVTAIVVARGYGPTSFGAYAFAFSFIALFLPLGDLGLTLSLLRKYQALPVESRPLLIGRVLVTRLLLGAIAMMLALGVAALFRFEPQIREFILIGVLVVFASTSDIFAAQLQAHDAQSWVAAGEILEQLVIVTMSITAVLAGGPMAVIVAAVVIGAYARFGFLLMRATRFGRPRFGVKFGEAAAEIRASGPLFVMTMAIVVYSEIDMVLVGRLMDPESLGLYSAAKRIARIWGLVPGALVLALYPILHRLHLRGDVEQFRSLTVASQRLVAWVMSPIAFGLAALAGPVMRLIYGETFAGGNLAFATLVLAQALLAGKLVNDYVLMSTSRDSVLVLLNVGLLGVVVAGNLILVPRFGILIPGIVLGFAYVLYFMVQAAWTSGRQAIFGFAASHFRPIIASAAMALVLWYFGFLSLWMLIPLGAISYAIFLALMGDLVPARVRATLATMRLLRR